MWFEYSEEQNAVSFIEIPIDFVFGYLKNVNFKIEFIDGTKGISIDDNKKYCSLMDKEDLNKWINKDHYLKISELMGIHGYNIIDDLKIIIEGGGSLHYFTGELIVKLPDGVDIITPTKKILEIRGYYASDKIIEICRKIQRQLNLNTISGFKGDETDFDYFVDAMSKSALNIIDDEDDDDLFIEI